LVRELSTEIKIPTIPDSFPELKHLSEVQLTRLLRDEVAVQAMVDTIASVESMKSLLDQLRATNLHEATATMAQEEELSRLYSEVTTLQEGLRADTARYQSTLSEAVSKHSTTPAACLQLLRTRTGELKKASDGVALRIQAGDRDVKELLSLLAEYEGIRTKYHTLCAIAKLTNTPSYT
jgi:hypothetical protein